MAKEVASEGDALVCGGLSPVNSYSSGQGEEATRKEFKTQIEVFFQHKVDFMLAEVDVCFLIFYSDIVYNYEDALISGNTIVLIWFSCTYSDMHLGGLLFRGNFSNFTKFIS